MKKVDAEIVYLEVLRALNMDTEGIEPYRREVSIARACLCYVLRHGIGYTRKQIAEEIGWTTPQTVTAPVSNIRNGLFDDNHRLNGMTCAQFCDNIIRGLSVRYDGVRIIPVGYGHTPLS
jgi:hypothetical protein